MIHTIYYLGVFGVMLAYALFEGMREAWFYHVLSQHDNYHKPWKWDEHTFFLLQRSIVFLLFMIVNKVVLGMGWPFVLSGLAMMLFFFVFHVGFYYSYRNRYNGAVYQDRFWDDDERDPGQPKTIEINSSIRKVILLVACTCYLLSYILQINR